jgi:hypothetical protein
MVQEPEEEQGEDIMMHHQTKHRVVAEAVMVEQVVTGNMLVETLGFALEQVESNVTITQILHS